MQDLPPPPAYECVKAEAATTGKSYLTIAGDPAQVGALLQEAKAYPRWSVEADVTTPTVRFVRLQAPLNIPYREVGGLIYNAQRRRLTVGFTSDPLICELEEKK